MTSHTDPATEAVSRETYWDAGTTFADFLPTATDNVDLWRRTYERARVPDDLVARAEAVPGAWRLLVISEDWCGDASNTVPVLAAFAEAAPNVDLRIVERDQNLDLMDAHLTDGTKRAIPVAIVLDGQGRERGWWGPRPTDLQAWFYSDDAQALEKDDRYRELRKWYARDQGRTTIEEVLAIIEQAGGDGGVG
ncbi:MAG: thioredoxin family protein [Bacteroidota bacterium]